MKISKTVIDLTVLLERMALSSAMKKISKMTVTLSKFAPVLVRAQECLARMCMPFHRTKQISTPFGIWVGLEIMFCGHLICSANCRSG